MKLQEFSEIIAGLAKTLPEYAVYTDNADGRHDDGGPWPGHVDIDIPNKAVWICMDDKQEDPKP